MHLLEGAQSVYCRYGHPTSSAYDLKQGLTDYGEFIASIVPDFEEKIGQDTAREVYEVVLGLKGKKLGEIDEMLKDYGVIDGDEIPLSEMDPEVREMFERVSGATGNTRYI